MVAARPLKETFVAAKNNPVSSTQMSQPLCMVTALARERATCGQP